MKILYVEDNPDAVHPIRRIATYIGAEFLTTDTIEEGLRLLRQQPTLVLHDMMLPDGDAIKFIRQARLQGSTVPIIVMSGFSPEGESEACLAAGATAYYTKPVDVDVLVALFRKYGTGGHG
jgi:DNA-binding response OmpR family regulator